MIIPLAHLGHVLIDLPVFMGPVAALVTWLLIVTRRDRRREASRTPGAGPSADGA
jgi:hypothetical protein